MKLGLEFKNHNHNLNPNKKKPQTNQYHQHLYTIKNEHLKIKTTIYTPKMKIERVKERDRE